MNSLLRVTSNHSRLLFSLSSSPLSSISASLPDFNFYSSNRLIVSSTKNRSLPLVISTRHMSTENFFIQVHTSMINSKPVLAFQEALVQIHAYTGLPWAVEIVACGLILRTALFPLAIYERKQQAKYENLGPQLEQHMFGVNEQLKVKMAKQELTRSEAKKRFQKAVFLKRRQLILDHNLHPFKRVIVVLFQIPIWVTMSCALGNLCLRSPYIEQPRIRTLATEAAPQLQTEGLLWFQDLTLADPTYILPIVFGSLFMANVLVIKKILSSCFHANHATVKTHSSNHINYFVSSMPTCFESKMKLNHQRLPKLFQFF